LLEGKNVGAERNLRRIEQMSRPVARQQKDRHARPGGFDDRIARPAEGRVDLVPRSAARLDAQRLAPTRSADQTDPQLAHVKGGYACGGGMAKHPRAPRAALPVADARRKMPISSTIRPPVSVV